MGATASCLQSVFLFWQRPFNPGLPVLPNVNAQAGFPGFVRDPLPVSFVD